MYIKKITQRQGYNVIRIFPRLRHKKSKEKRKG